MTERGPRSDGGAAADCIRGRPARAEEQRTRDALLRVALELFTTKGYEQTTVDEIADAVDVSQRTFFRYFASKEAVASRPRTRWSRTSSTRCGTAARRGAPFAGDAPGGARGLGHIEERLSPVVPVKLYMRTYQVIESTPALLAVHLRRSAELEEHIARLIAEREGLDVDADPRPRVAVAAFAGVMRARAAVGPGRGPERGGDPASCRRLPRPPRALSGGRLAGLPARNTSGPDGPHTRTGPKASRRAWPARAVVRRSPLKRDLRVSPWTLRVS